MAFSSSVTKPSASPRHRRSTSPSSRDLFRAKIKHLGLRLAPLSSVTTGTIHPDFPRYIVNFWLLTDAQLNNLAEFYHQNGQTSLGAMYPKPVHWHKHMPLEQKRRRFGRFIGLRGCESPIEGPSYSTDAYPSSSTPVSHLPTVNTSSTSPHGNFSSFSVPPPVTSFASSSTPTDADIAYSDSEACAGDRATESESEADWDMYSDEDGYDYSSGGEYDEDETDDDAYMDSDLECSTPFTKQQSLQQQTSSTQWLQDPHAEFLRQEKAQEAVTKTRFFY